MNNGVINLGEHRADAMHEAEKVWQLRAQVLEHVKAIGELLDQMEELPHVYGISPDGVDLYGIEVMLTPDDDESDPPKPGDEDYPAWRRWLAIKEAQNL